MSLLDRIKTAGLDPFPQLTEFIGKHLSKPRLIIFTAIFTKIFLDKLYKYAKIINPNAMLDEGGNETLDILEYYHPRTTDDVYEFLSSYGAKGRQAYVTYLYYDCGFLLARTLPLCLLSYHGFIKAPRWVRPGVWINLLTTSWDLFENLLIFLAIKLYPQRIDSLGYMVAVAIHTKWFLFWVTIALLCVSILSGIYFGFHTMLSNSVLMEKDVRERENAKRHVNDALQRQRAAASKKKA